MHKGANCHANLRALDDCVRPEPVVREKGARDESGRKVRNRITWALPCCSQSLGFFFFSPESFGSYVLS